MKVVARVIRGLAPIALSLATFGAALFLGAPEASAQSYQDPTLVVGGEGGEGGPFDSLTDIDGKIWKVYNEGVAAFNTGDLDIAEDLFRKALEKEERLAPAHLGLAEVYLKRQDHALALQEVALVTPAFPAVARAYEIQYEVAQATDDDAAVQEAKRSLSGLGPNLYVATNLYNEGVRIANGGDDEAAQALFEEAVSFQPDMVVALSALLDLAYDADDYPLTVSTAESLLAVNPRHREALKKRFNAYLFQGDVNNTVVAARALAAVDDSYDAPRLMRQGRELVRRGRAAHGVAALNAALELDPELHDAHFELGKGYAALESPDAAAARKHLEAYLAADPDGRKAGEAKEILAGLGS